MNEHKEKESILIPAMAAAVVMVFVGKFSPLLGALLGFGVFYLVKKSQQK